MTDRSDQATPQDTANGFREAAIQGRWEKVFEYMTVEAQTGLVAAAYAAAKYGAGSNQVAAILLIRLMEKYDLSEEEFRSREPGELLTIFRDLSKWAAKHLPADQRIDFAQEMSNTEYSEFRISEDSAHAIATNNDRRSEVRFRRIGDRWYVE